MTRFLVLALATAALPATSAARQLPDWRPGFGGGPGFTLHRGDAGGTDSASGIVRIALERTPRSGPSRAIEWIGVWFTATSVANHATTLALQPRYRSAKPLVHVPPAVDHGPVPDACRYSGTDDGSVYHPVDESRLRRRDKK